ncbi:radical SAM protein [Bradyrhizobium diazoefficiens]
MNLGILLWNKCDAKCAHCAVSSGPDQHALLTDDQLKRAIDACFYDDPAPKIGLSGGESFLYFKRLIYIVSYAASRGAIVSLNTNCSWALDSARAERKLGLIQEAGLRRLIVSTDEFHLAYIPAERVINVVRACKALNLEIELQFVATKTSLRLADFLKKYEDEFLNVRVREIPCHPVGRAVQEVDDDAIFRKPGTPTGCCPSAVLSIAADGRVIPCCNTAGHLPALQVGHVDDAIEDLHLKFRTDAVMHLMQRKGPHIFVAAATNAGFTVDRRGYVDQCHLCHDLFRDSNVAAAIKEYAANVVTEEVLNTVVGNSP